jgi:hypothetical protein
MNTVIPNNGTGSLNPQLTGNVGPVLLLLSAFPLGWNVMPTARNARGVDVIAYSADASRFVGVQVKKNWGLTPFLSLP